MAIQSAVVHGDTLWPVITQAAQVSGTILGILRLTLLPYLIYI